MKLLVKHNFAPEQKREIKASFKEERRAIRKRGSDLPSVRKELASKRDLTASEASKRGPERGKVKVGGGGEGPWAREGAETPGPRAIASGTHVRRDSRRMQAHTLPGVVVRRR